MTPPAPMGAPPMINRDLGNMQHRPKAWDWQTETYTY